MREKGITPRPLRETKRCARREKKTPRPPREKEKGSHYTRHDDDISERSDFAKVAQVAQIWFLVPCSLFLVR
jgi:hypothetical protein